MLPLGPTDSEQSPLLVNTGAAQSYQQQSGIPVSPNSTLKATTHPASVIEGIRRCQYHIQQRFLHQNGYRNPWRCIIVICYPCV